MIESPRPRYPIRHTRPAISETGLVKRGTLNYIYLIISHNLLMAIQS